MTGAGQQGIFNTAFSLSFEIIGPALRLAGYIFYLIAIYRVSFHTLTFAGHLLRLVFLFYYFLLQRAFLQFHLCLCRVPFLPWISLQTVMGLAPSLAFAVGLIVVYIVIDSHN